MKTHQISASLIVLTTLISVASGQTPPSSDTPVAKELRTVPIKGQRPAIFTHPMRCDTQGGVYYQIFDSDAPANWEITRVNSAGEKKQAFSIQQSPELSGFSPAPQFAISLDGTVHQLAYSNRMLHAVSFNSDGTLKSAVRLQEKISPSQLAIFPSGEVLVVGRRPVKDAQGASHQEAFTALFRKDGTFLKRLIFPDDSIIDQGVEKGDVEFVDPINPKSTNLAISLGDAVVGSNGKVYLLRRLRPAVVYEIDSNGQFSRIEVSSADSQAFPITLKEAKGRLAVLFQNETTNKVSVRVVSTGSPVSPEHKEEYELNHSGAGLACFSEQGELTFVGVADRQPVLKVSSVPLE